MSNSLYSTYQNDTTTPDIHLASGVEGVADNELGSCVARATATCLHEITLPGSVALDAVQTHSFHEFPVGEVKLLLLSEILIRIESVGKAKVGNNDVAVAVQEQVFQFQISVNDSLLVKIADTRNKLGKQTAGRIVLQVSVVENIVEQLASRCILENDANVSLCLDLVDQAHDIRVLDTSQNGNFSVDLGESRRVAANTVPFNKLDSNLWRIVSQLLEKASREDASSPERCCLASSLA